MRDSPRLFGGGNLFVLYETRTDRLHKKTKKSLKTKVTHLSSILRILRATKELTPFTSVLCSVPFSPR